MAAALCVTAMVAVPQPASAGDYVCSVGDFCVWEHKDYTGGIWTQFYSDPDFRNDVMSNGVGLDNRITSIRNKDTSCAILLYRYANYSGFLYLIRPGWSWSDFTTLDMNDMVSSALWDCP